MATLEFLELNQTSVLDHPFANECNISAPSPERLWEVETDSFGSASAGYT